VQLAAQAQLAQQDQLARQARLRRLRSARSALEPLALTPPSQTSALLAQQSLTSAFRKEPLAQQERQAPQARLVPQALASS
jgi:hypothetical protein